VGDVDDLQHKLAQNHELYRVDREVMLQKYNWDLASTETDKLYTSLLGTLSKRRWSVAREFVSRSSIATSKRV
jgi:hypothetical protein